MNAQSIPADQVDFQDTTTEHTNGFSLLAGFIGFYQDAQRIKREARQVYAMNDTDLLDMGIASREDIPAHLASMYQK
jgi:hypothetical protein